MKLAEALIQRADAQKRLAQLKYRLQEVAQVQEGETPHEEPQDLLTEIRRTIREIETLIKQINDTNAQTAFDDNRSLMHALAERDMLMEERGALTNLVAHAAVRQNRYSMSEIRYVSTVDVAALQTEIDDLSRRYRELDTAIQSMNWTTDLVE